MRSLQPNGSEFQQNATSLMGRLVLRPNEVFRLPLTSAGIKVVAGIAWVTVNGQDIFLALGERLLLPAHRDSALISALGRTFLILEIFGAAEAVII